MLSGGHRHSLAWVAAGEVSAAAIDSNVLRLALRDDPALAARLRVIDALGPFPIQPIAARATLPAATRAAITGALLALRGPKLAAFGVTGLEAP